jgi:polyferredoxin
MMVGTVLLVFTAITFADEEPARVPMGFFDFWLLPRVWMSAIFAVVGILLLAKNRVNRKLRTVLLPVIFFVFAVLWVLPLGKFAQGMGLHPSPVCTITKPFLFLKMRGFIPIGFVSIFVSIAVLTIVGNKSFCGWVCPIGALQELLNRIRLPKLVLPFNVTNPIRFVIFVVFVAVAFAAGFEIYAYFNPFETLHWGLEWYGLMVLGIVMVAGLFMFRPFCYLICPLGLLTWILEHVSIVRVRVDKAKCDECNSCVDESYCPAVQSILDMDTSRPDCHICGRCIDSCPEDALKFK